MNTPVKINDVLISLVPIQNTINSINLRIIVFCKNSSCVSLNSTVIYFEPRFSKSIANPAKNLL